MPSDPSHPCRALVAVLELMAVAACAEPVAPEPSITGMDFRVMTEEAEGFQNLMLVGDSGTADVTVHNGALGVSADRVAISFASSDSTVVALGPEVGGCCRLRAPQPGAVYIAARVGAFRDSAQVEVLTEPRPVDWITVTLAPISRDLDATFDAVGSLSTLTLTGSRQRRAVDGRAAQRPDRRSRAVHDHVVQAGGGSRHAPVPLRRAGSALRRILSLGVDQRDRLG